MDIDTSLIRLIYDSQDGDKIDIIAQSTNSSIEETKQVIMDLIIKLNELKQGPGIC